MLGYARECRDMARAMTREDQRAALIQMAEAWESLAAEAGDRPGTVDEGLRPDELTTENDR